MKRSLIIAAVFGIVVGFVGCGNPPAPCAGDSLLQRPQLCPDRDSLGFAQEFGSGTFIGTKPVENLAIRNGGIEDLTLSAVATTGDPAFKFSASWDDTPGDNDIPGISVKGNTTVFIQVEFAPTQAKQYTASVTVTSNAENSPQKVFQVSGCGVPADGGASPCYRDGGTGP